MGEAPRAHERQPQQGLADGGGYGVGGGTDRAGGAGEAKGNLKRENVFLPQSFEL